MSGTAFDVQRREWQFERMRAEHGRCCVGAIDLGWTWVAVLAPHQGMRRWDQSFEEWSSAPVRAPLEDS